MLPNADRAEIDRGKLQDYLLSPTHPVGRFKARFFAALGYSSEGWRELAADLRGQHLTASTEPPESGPHGQTFTIRAMPDVYDSRYPEGTERAIGGGP